MVEGGNGKDADGIDHYFDQYEPGTAKGETLGNTEKDDGELFRGRDYVQVTGRANYAEWSKKLGLPDEIVAGKPVPYLVAHPEKLTEPKIAAEVMVRGMQQPHGFRYDGNLDTYINPKRTDFYDARNIVNSGHDRASDIASAAQSYAGTLTKDAAQIDARLTPLNAHIHDLNAQGAKIVHATTLKPWDGKPHGGTVVKLDETTYAMHIGRGIYQTLDLNTTCTASHRRTGSSWTSTSRATSTPATTFPRTPAKAPRPARR